MITLKLLKNSIKVGRLGHFLYYEGKSSYKPAKNIKEAWQLFVPPSMQTQLGLTIVSNSSAFTELFSGKEDKGNHSTKRRREDFYNMIMGNTSYFYNELLAHCEEMINLNIKIESYIRKNKNENINDVAKEVKLLDEGTCEYEKIKIEFQSELKNIFLMTKLKEELYNDQRLSLSLREYIMRNVEEDFSVALAWMVLVAFFGENQDDIDRIKKIEKRYINVTKEIIKTGKVLFSEKYVDLNIKFINALLCCEVKWGPYSDDGNMQNANVCEGALALYAVSSRNEHKSYIMDAFKYLQTQKNELGIPSKSLDTRTVVPTSMYLYFVSCLKKVGWIDDRCWLEAGDIVKNLWNMKGEDGWGIYVMKHNRKVCNIGCTYWAMRAINEYKEFIPENEYNKYLRDFFRYKGINLFGSSLNETLRNGLRVKLYATSMMLYLYFICDDKTKVEIDKTFDYKKALEFILKSFDMREYISEIEEIEGTDEGGKTSIHYVSWTHITLRYCMDAVAEAIKLGKLEKNEIDDFFMRLYNMTNDYIYDKGLIAYWIDRNKIFEKEGRGYSIFPTMHVLAGMANLEEVINKME